LGKRAGIGIALKKYEKYINSDPYKGKLDNTATQQTNQDAHAFAKCPDSEKRQIERWTRLQKILKQDQTKLNKFNESAWRLFFYTCSFSLGLCVVWNKPWFWDVDQCYINHPYHVT